MAQEYTFEDSIVGQIGFGQNLYRGYLSYGESEIVGSSNSGSLTNPITSTVSSGSIESGIDFRGNLVEVGDAGISGEGSADDSVRFWAGSSFEDRATAPFRVYKDGSGVATSLTISTGVISYGKTSFSDSTNAGYYISSSGVYFGSASDATYIKYNIGTGAFSVNGAITTNTGSSINGTYLTSASVTGTAIASATITATNIANATITATQIANATITSTQISGTAGITGSQIGSATITGSNIASATITGSNIGTTTITSGNIANATITSTQISGTAGITGGQIASATITTTNISATAGIIGGQIDNLTITAGNIANLTITASQIANSTITGGKIASNTITGSLLKIGNQSWSHDLVFSSTDLDTVAWALGTITMADGTTTYSIVAGNTGNMTARTYIYLDIAVSITILQTTTSAGTAVGDDKILIAVAQNSTTEATFQVFGGIGGIAIKGGDIENLSITNSQIAANTITANEIFANTITASQIATATITTTQIAANTIIAGNIAAGTITGTEIAATTIAAGNIVANTITSSQLTTGAFVTATANISDAIITSAKISDLAVSKLTAGSITSKDIVLAVAAGTGDVAIRAGKTDFTNTESGFILGLDDSDSDKPKFYIGDTTHWFSWDGATAEATNFYNLKTYTAGENITTGNVVCVKPSYTDYSPTADTYISSGLPNTNYGTADPILIDNGATVYKMLIKFDSSSWVSAERIVKAELIFTSSGAYGTSLGLTQITGAWDEGTVTWNTEPTSGADFATTNIYGILGTFTGAAVMTMDITQLVRQWKAGNLTNNGLNISANGSFFIYSKENGTASNRPILRIYDSSSSDGKVYKADEDDYLLCRSVIGVANETKTSGQTVKVHTTGFIALSGNIGESLFLSGTAGLATNNAVNLTRNIRLGFNDTATTAIFQLERKGIYIEKQSSSSFSANTNPIKFYVPGETTRVDFEFVGSAAAEGIIISAERGRTTKYHVTSYTGDNCIVITWGDYYVQVDTDGGESFTLRNYYVYT